MYAVIAKSVFVMHVDRAYILSGMFTEAVHSRQVSGDLEGSVIEQHLRAEFCTQKTWHWAGKSGFELFDYHTPVGDFFTALLEIVRWLLSRSSSGADNPPEGTL
jgi:hypothetical protein